MQRAVDIKVCRLFNAQRCDDNVDRDAQRAYFELTALAVSYGAGIPFREHVHRAVRRQCAAAENVALCVDVVRGNRRVGGDGSQRYSKPARRADCCVGNCVVGCIHRQRAGHQRSSRSVDISGKFAFRFGYGRKQRYANHREAELGFQNVRIRVGTRRRANGDRARNIERSAADIGVRFCGHERLRKADCAGDITNGNARQAAVAADYGYGAGFNRVVERGRNVHAVGKERYFFDVSILRGGNVGIRFVDGNIHATDFEHCAADDRVGSCLRSRTDRNHARVDSARAADKGFADRLRFGKADVGGNGVQASFNAACCGGQVRRCVGRKVVDNVDVASCNHSVAGERSFKRARRVRIPRHQACGSNRERDVVHFCVRRGTAVAVDVDRAASCEVGSLDYRFAGSVRRGNRNIRAGNRNARGSGEDIRLRHGGELAADDIGQSVRNLEQEVGVRVQRRILLGCNAERTRQRDNRAAGERGFLRALEPCNGSGNIH